MHVEILSAPFVPYRYLADYEAQHSELTGKFGATANFVGTMRDFNENAEVMSMVLEHYPEMTIRHLQTICARAEERWELLDIVVVHRIGELYPGDPIVLVAVWSAHRKDAFEACRFIMEDLKSEAPFWKKETLPRGERWVEKNTPGY